MHCISGNALFADAPRRCAAMPETIASISISLRRQGSADEPTSIREVNVMPKGSVPKREAKKPKKNAQKRDAYISPVIAGDTVEVVGKRRRRRDEDVVV